MAEYKDWSGEERRRAERRAILERRRQARKEAKDRRAKERRLEQICYLCHGVFVPKVKGAPLICETCEADSLRGGPRFRPRF